MKRLEKVFIYMYNHYSEKITLEEMAHECFMSPNYFSSYFKKITECTFSNYLHGIRVRQAQKLLNTSDMGIAQIALECGFNNISNFYRIYKNFTGKNPGDERNRTHKTKQEM
jgi:transcriptional regulator GlxA family with amidase domain